MTDSNFIEYKLEDICELITDGSHFSPPSIENGFPMASVKDMTKYGINYSKCRTISLDDFNKLKKANCSPQIGDVLISKDGSILSEVFVHNNSKEIVLLSSIAILRTNKRTNPYYLKYCLDLPSIKNLVRSGYVTGSVLPRVVLKDFKRLPILVPQSKNLEDAITYILKTLDDKIELNQKMNQNLEETAKALFKSWFIDFDPVKAKAEGRPTGLSQEISDLFPDSFEDSELVEIPKGWRKGILNDIVLRSKEKIGNIESKVLSAVTTGELVLSEEYFSKKVYSKNTSKYLKVSKHEFAYNPSRINIGSIGMNKKDYIGAVSPIYVVFKSNEYFHWFIEKFLQLKSTKNIINILSTGSVRQTLSFENFSSISCVIPDKKVMKKFNNLYDRIIAVILNKQKEIEILTNIRDTLLPKLISGELRIKDAEKLIEEAGI
tara:strand:- start:335 stop:1636 length:1302 start_codon:yes stop_codon:yes gene_type:complete